MDTGHLDEAAALSLLLLDVDIPVLRVINRQMELHDYQKQATKLAAALIVLGYNNGKVTLCSHAHVSTHAENHELAYNSTTQ